MDLVYVGMKSGQIELEGFTGKTIWGREGLLEEEWSILINTGKEIHLEVRMVRAGKSSGENRELGNLKGLQVYRESTTGKN